VIRDLNASITNRLFTDTSWWLGWHPIGRGTNFTPKLFPSDESFTALLSKYSFFHGEVAATVSQFVSVPKDRELFDLYLSYATDEAFQQRFTSRMQSAFATIRPYLSINQVPVLVGGSQTLQGLIAS